MAEGKTKPVLYQTLLLLDRTLEDEFVDLFDNGAYWRAKNNPQKQIDAAWRITLEFIGAVRFNPRALAAEGVEDPAFAAKQFFLAAEERIKELADAGYLEKSHFVAGVLAARTLSDAAHETAWLHPYCN